MATNYVSTGETTTLPAPTGGSVAGSPQVINDLAVMPLQSGSKGTLIVYRTGGNWSVPADAALKAGMKASVKAGALVLVNSSQALEKVTRDDLRAFYIPSMEEAARLGNIKVANMIMLGAYIRATGALRIETLEKMLAHIFTGPKAHLVELNIKALQTGAGYIA